MLNLFEKKTQNDNIQLELRFFNENLSDLYNLQQTYSINNINNKDYVGENRHSVPASNEWFNSIYSFDKNSTKTLPIADKVVDKLIKSYFNLNPLRKNKKSSRVQVRFKRLSLNRILVSKAEMKHTSNKVIITVYVYNKNKKFFLYKLEDLYKKFLFKVAEKKPNLTKRKKGINQRTKKTNMIFLKNRSSTRLNKNNRLNKNSRLNKNTRVNRAYTDVKFNGRNKFRILFLKPSNNKSLSKFSSNRFKNSSRGRLAHQQARFIKAKTNYYIKFTKLTKRNLSNFLLALNRALKKNTGHNALNHKYKSLIKKYYYLLSNKKVNIISNNNYYLNYVNIAKTNSSLKNNNNIEKSYLYSVEEEINFSAQAQTLSFLSLKKNSFFSTRLGSGTAPGQIQIETRRNNNYYKLFNNLKSPLDFENVSLLHSPSKKNQKNQKNQNNFFRKKNQNQILALQSKKIFTFGLYKLKNLHKLFLISPNSNEKINAHHSQSNFFELSQARISDIALKKRNFILKNLHKILKTKSTLAQKKKIISTSPSSLTKKINSISLKGLRILKKASKNKNFLFKLLGWRNKNFRIYETKYYKNFINKSYRKEILYLYYVKMLSLNNNKFKNWFLLGLKRIISKIYHKKVEFNLVNLKYLHLNSDIFSESIAIKLRNRENRLLRVLKKALKLVKIPSLSKLSLYGSPSERIPIDSDSDSVKFARNESEILNLNSDMARLNNKDVLHELLYNIFPHWGLANLDNSPINVQKKGFINKLQENILNSTEHKNIYGVRLEAAGRLSRRLTASRSIFKLKYKGSLKNINSSYKGLSTVMVRGNTRSNIQLTKVSSKTRNGAFGLKGWISSN